MNLAEAKQLLREISQIGPLNVAALHGQEGWYDDDGVRQGGLIAFVRYFWHILEPGRPFVDGWPLWALAAHLEAVSFGRVKRLLINVPPGFMKSLLTDVFWPAWEWSALNRPNERFLTFSYANTLTERDNRRFLLLISSPDFQEVYGKKFKIERDGVQKVENDKRGWKIASSIGGVSTGERGDCIIFDDPHKVDEAESELKRTGAVRFFREVMQSRLNDPDKTSIVVIMQRVHEDDVSGNILSTEGMEYCYLCIPMEYDSSRQVLGDGTPVTNEIGWHDPRYREANPHEADGELAWPDRYSPDACYRLQVALGPHAWAGQFQQLPAPRGGGIFQRDWWQVWDAPDRKFPPCEYIIASLDGAFTEKEENNPSALTIWGIFTANPEPETQGWCAPGPSGGEVRQGEVTSLNTVEYYAEDNVIRPKRFVKQRRIILLDAWRKHLRFSSPDLPKLRGELPNQYLHRVQPHWGLLEWVAHSCDKYKVDTLLIEAKGPGISAAQALRSKYGLKRWTIKLIPAKGDKVARAMSAQPTFSQGLVYAPTPPRSVESGGIFSDWAQMVIDEMAVFPRGKYDDLTDSAVHAVNYLRTIGEARDDEEASAGMFDGVMHKRKKAAIYDI